MPVLIFTVLAVGLPVAVAIEMLRWALSTEEQRKRAGRCLMAIGFFASGASIAWYGFEGLKVVTHDKIDGRPAAIATICVFSLFVAVCAFCSVSRGIGVRRMDTRRRRR
jgi:hypothetical protein